MTNHQAPAAPPAAADTARARPTAWIPTVPMRWDHEEQIAKPVVRLEPAELWGTPRVLLKPRTGSVSAYHIGPLIQTMREVLRRDARTEDYVVAVGDPALIVAVAGIMLKMFGRANLLRWDRLAARYVVVEVEV